MFASWFHTLPWVLSSLLVLVIIATSISILLWIIGLLFILRQNNINNRVHKQYTHTVKTAKDTEKNSIEKLATPVSNASHHSKKKNGYHVGILLICIILFALAVFGGWSLWLILITAGIVVFVLLSNMFGKGSISVSTILFLVVILLITTSMTRAWPIDLTHFLKNSEEEYRKNAQQNEKKFHNPLPDHYATMYITCDGVRYEGLVPGVWYDVPETINTINLIVTMSGKEIHTGPDNPLVIWNKSSKKDPAWFYQTDIRLQEPCSGASKKITLMPIHTE